MDLSLLLLAAEQFLDQGGNVLWAIILLSIVLFFGFFERFIFLTTTASELEQQLLRSYREHPGHYTRLHLQKEARRNFFQGNSYLKFGISLLPLLGLLGTVSGMIEVFDVMGHFGNSNPRLMASGVAKAIIPTMSGMAVAVIGLIIYHFLHLQMKRRMRHFEHLINERTQ